jgi:alpha-beta hydrolase superfamily lysophospholipase|tara:strand:- start:2184 stop:3119 length:936 start_codon:yes stop_codon:yes gene_type:complete
MTIERTKIVEAIGPLELGKCIESAVINSYWQFYGINFSRTIDGVSQTIGFVPSDRFEVCCQVFTPLQSIGTCFVVHGYFDHSGLYGHLIKKLLELSYTVVALDLPGHGLSSGARADINSFFSYEEALQSVLNKCSFLPRPWHGIGQSTGCSVLLLSLIRSPSNSFTKTVFFAPLLRPRYSIKGRILQPILSLFKEDWPRYFSNNSHDAKFLYFVKNTDPFQARVLPFKWLKAMRQWVVWILKQKRINADMLVIQGDKDATVDGEFNINALEKRVSKIQVSHHSEARHHLVNEAEAIRELLFTDMAQFLKAS